ncbi:hypothetical protein QTI94_08135 [Clostridium perfringens]|nr:hypothetical protein [Clostridium perfringens]
MIYREKKIYSGNMLEVENYPITLRERKHSRKRKVKESLPKQKNLNDKNSKKYLSRLLNTNFTDQDYFATFGYVDSKRPESYERAIKDFDNFLKRLRRFLRKNNRPELKYIFVIEYDEDINIHFHMVLNGIVEFEELEKIWGKGNVEVSRLKANELGYEELAKYMVKDPKGKRRWSPSRNLKKPKVSVNDYKYSNRKIREIANCQGDRSFIESLYPGYTLREFYVNFNEINSSFYITIKLQKIGGYENVRKSNIKNKRRN